MNNMIRTFVLLAALTAFLGWAGLMLGGQQGMMIALIMAAAMNFGSWWYSGDMVLKLYRAQPVSSGPLFDMVQDLAVRAGLPVPRVYIMDSRQPNAFATGRNPANGAVAVTSGLMNILNERELRGVVAHELAHIKNYDTLTMTITATLAGALSMLANFAMFFGSSRERGGGMLATLALMILAPLAASLVQMAISRTREYAADNEGALICGDPLALASALEKLEQGASRIDNHLAEDNPATAHMFIINPLHMRAMDNLFATHPSTANRIAALSRLAGVAGEAPSSGKFRNPWRRKKDY